MRMLVRLLATFAIVCGGIAPIFDARADQADPVRVTSGLSYQLIARWDVDKLNTILKSDAPKYFGLAVPYTPARNAVRLYRVTYASVIPERGNKPTVATGLLAVPEVSATEFPLLSYQHGTVFGREQVPSFPDQSPETQLVLAQFAGQGYIVIGADYFGLGQSQEPEGFMVKGSHQQATHDMLSAARVVLEQMKLSTTRTFLGGWSQGGFVTMALLERLESAGVPVAGAATASGAFDGYAFFSGFLDFPRKTDAGWVTTLFILSSFSFESYYGVPGLARSLINDDGYEVSRKLYDRRLQDPGQIPTDLRKLVRPDYFDPSFFATSAFGRLLNQKTNAYRWIVKTPVRNYFGEADEVITPGLGALAMTYQRAMGGGNMRVDAISTGQTNHRGTYATAVPLWKRWFDER